MFLQILEVLILAEINMPKRVPKTTGEQLQDLYGHVTGLKKDIFILKDNHIRHMHEDIDKIDKKVDTVA
jgi:hypothetical protein